jgi:hypothetical protein
MVAARTAEPTDAGVRHPPTTRGGNLILDELWGRSSSENGTGRR